MQQIHFIPHHKPVIKVIRIKIFHKQCYLCNNKISAELPYKFRKLDKEMDSIFMFRLWKLFNIKHCNFVSKTLFTASNFENKCTKFKVLTTVVIFIDSII